MRALIQRVSRARVTVGEEEVGRIGPGLLVLLGVGEGDGEEQVGQLVDKIVHLRIFPDDEGKMNRSLLDIGGQCLVVSQFTLYGDCRRGRRPSYSKAARPEVAERLYEAFIAAVRDRGVEVAAGRFGAMMAVELVNDGPVTLWLDTDEL